MKYEPKTLTAVLALPPQEQAAYMGSENQEWHKLRRQVEGYFESNYQAPERYLIKHLVINLLAVLAVTYLMMVFSTSVVWVLFLAVAFAFIHVQMGFLMHGFAHMQAFTKHDKVNQTKLNTVLGLLVTNVVLMYSFVAWRCKHDEHHYHSNIIDEDPDLEIVLALHEANAKKQKSTLWSVITMFQGILFYPFLAGFQGFIMRKKAIMYPLQTRHKQWKLHLILTLVGMGLNIGVPLLLLPFWHAVLFVFISQVVTGNYLVASFAFNHKAMPKIEPGTKLSWIRLQAQTACNVNGGVFPRLMSYLLGGLNLQIEHHLWPRLPYYRLWEVQAIVQPEVERLGIEYTSKSFLAAQWSVLMELHRLGYWERKKLPRFIRQLLGDCKRDTNPVYAE